MGKKILAPSMLAADFTRLGGEIAAIERAGAQYLHLDVMDGMFVPSYSFGFPVIQSVRTCTKLFFDVHLMIEEPDRYLEEFVKAGADSITVHAEACRHLDRTINQIHELGAKAGVALNPATPLSALDWVLKEVDMVLLMTVNPGFGGQKFIPSMTEKIAALRERLEEKGLDTDIQVDGGISVHTAELVLNAGANVLVAGSAVFGDDTEGRAKALLQKINEFDG